MALTRQRPSAQTKPGPQSCREKQFCPAWHGGQMPPPQPTSDMPWVSTGLPVWPCGWRRCSEQKSAGRQVPPPHILLRQSLSMRHVYMRRSMDVRNGRR